MGAILIIIILGLVFYGCFRLGGAHINKENTTLRNQLILQEKFSRNWAAEATDKYQLSSQIVQQQTATTAAQIQMVIQLLQAIQKEQGQNLSSNENEKINQLIQQAKQVIQN